jgi:hypothetical protein
MRSLAAFLLILSILLGARVARAEIAPTDGQRHSATWTTGAIITFTSIGVSLLGAALVLTSFHGDVTENEGYTDMASFATGIMFSAIGDGGMLIGGPATWIAGIGRPE